MLLLLHCRTLHTWSTRERSVLAMCRPMRLHISGACLRSNAAVGTGRNAMRAIMVQQHLWRGEHSAWEHLTRVHACRPGYVTSSVPGFALCMHHASMGLGHAMGPQRKRRNGGVQ